MRRNELVGAVFGRLTVRAVYGLNKKKNVLWDCVCVCGGSAVATAYDLRGGKVKSCGCLAKEGRNTTHGMARAASRRSREYSIWAAMVQRCTNVNDRAFANYGGRGITVSKRWLVFENFFADMGRRPDGLYLERRNNNKGYSKCNCYWATPIEQGRNKRSNVYVKIDGKKLVLADAIALLKKSRQAVYYHVHKYGLTVQEVFDLWLQKKVL